jgi:glycerol transport system permease protein
MNQTSHTPGKCGFHEQAGQSHRHHQCASQQPLRQEEHHSRWLVPGLYILFLMLPIYWLINMSFKTNQEILSSFTLFPAEPTLHNYTVIFTDPSWYTGYINSLIYVGLNTVISICVPHCRRPTPSRGTAFLATSTCSSGCSPTGWRPPRCSCCRSSSSTPPLA